MINAQMTEYKYFVYKENEYGEQVIDISSSGTILMAINLVNKEVTDNILYTNANYIGLTLDNSITDKFVIEYGKEKLKVLYVNPQGRYKQVFMAKVS